MPVVFEFVAQTQSSRQVNIQARVSGFLDKRVYTEGSMVKEGQVLFLMDKKPFQAQLDQSKAALQQQLGPSQAPATSPLPYCLTLKPISALVKIIAFEPASTMGACSSPI